MTCIVTLKTKKELKERIARLALAQMGGLHDFHADFYIQDPSFFEPNKSCNASELAEGEEVVVTNHPKRSWFAQVGRKGGKLYVK